MTESSSQIATANPKGDPLQLHLLPCWDARTEPDGRLAIRGAPLLTGFLSLHGNTWQLTSPLSPDGFFTTNDRATITNRSLQFLGRSDHTVKILGELVDIDAVERALTNAGMPPESGCVIPTHHPRNGTALALLTEANATTATLWAAKAAASLPPFARISAIHPDLTLPRSPLGKLLRATAATLLPPANPD
jgi:acyl-CoA synthetase (AMP-forming)/AMP-acid ligase II